MFDEMKAQVKIIPLSLTRLTVSQSARQSLSIYCHHSTLGTDCVSSSEIRACLSGDSWFIIEVSAGGGGGGGGGGGSPADYHWLAPSARMYAPHVAVEKPVEQAGIDH